MSLLRRLTKGIAIALCAIMLGFVGPARAEAPASGQIIPAVSIAGVALGQDYSTKVLPILGKPEIAQQNSDGTVVYEWGVIPGGDITPPNAKLWVLTDGGKVVKVGSDAPGYLTADGLGYGAYTADFMRVYGPVYRNVAPYFFVFPVGLGITVNSSDGRVTTVWIEDAISQ